MHSLAKLAKSLVLSRNIGALQTVAVKNDASKPVCASLMPYLMATGGQWPGVEPAHPVLALHGTEEHRSNVLEIPSAVLTVSSTVPRRLVDELSGEPISPVQLSLPTVSLLGELRPLCADQMPEDANGDRALAAMRSFFATHPAAAGYFTRDAPPHFFEMHVESARLAGRGIEDGPQSIDGDLYCLADPDPLAQCAGSVVDWANQRLAAALPMLVQHYGGLDPATEPVHDAFAFWVDSQGLELLGRLGTAPSDPAAWRAFRLPFPEPFTDKVSVSEAIENACYNLLDELDDKSNQNDNKD